MSYLARYTGHTNVLYAYQVRRWFGWCEARKPIDRRDVYRMVLRIAQIAGISRHVSPHPQVAGP